MITLIKRSIRYQEGVKDEGGTVYLPRGICLSRAIWYGLGSILRVKEMGSDFIG
jgi:hypothetical protein